MGKRDSRGHLGNMLGQKRLRLSCEVDECKPLGGGQSRGGAGGRGGSAGGRGLHSFAFQLNISAFYGTGGAFRGPLVGV